MPRMEGELVAESYPRRGQECRMYWKMVASWSKTADATTESARILVQHLTRHVTEAHLKDVFSNYGEVLTVHMPLNHPTRDPTNKGHAEITFSFAVDARKAASRLNGGQLDGVALVVSLVRPPAPGDHAKERERIAPPPSKRQDDRDRDRRDMNRGDSRDGPRDFRGDPRDIRGPGRPGPYPSRPAAGGAPPLASARPPLRRDL
ncbi:hypothetical protein HK101_011897 [Irineochytrium annulatum]|nr:hypothetical protein HK101_011897 [Irineochytrium annulatum]